MKSIDDFTQAAFQESLHDLTSSILANPLCEPNADPKAVLLGGQSGAGKTTLHNIYKAQLEGNVVIINGDEYRKLHPNFAAIQDQYGIDAPAHTAAWAGDMVETLVDDLSMQGYNLIIEGTLCTSSAPMKAAQLLRDRGYNVSLAIMAVKPEISLTSCQIRYDQMSIAGTTPRAVDSAHHERIVRDIVGNLAALESSELFSQVELFNRAGTCLVQVDCPNEHGAASAALDDVLFGEWTAEERRHYENLQMQLAHLKGSGSGKD